MEGFRDDFFMVQADMAANTTGVVADLWVRYIDPNNGYRIRGTGLEPTCMRGPRRGRERLAMDDDGRGVPRGPVGDFPLLFSSLLPSIATRAVLANTAQSCNPNTITLSKIVNGQETALAAGTFPSDGSGAVKVKIYDDAGSHRFKVWVNGTLQINVTNATKFDDLTAVVIRRQRVQPDEL